MTDQLERESIWIPKDREPVLKTELNKLNKKADKLGCPHVSYRIVDTDRIVAKGYEEQARRWGAENCPKVDMIKIELDGEGPKIEGWKFLGTLDHITLPGSVIINTVPGEEIPQELHNSEPVCDHCGKIRRRNETFVLEEEATGEHKRVGRQCVRDFIGYDPSAIIRFLSSLDRLVESFGDEERWGFGGGRQDYVFDHDEVLRVTAAMIDKYGWVPRSAMNEDHNATANDVIRYYFPPSAADHKELHAWSEWRATLNIEDPRWIKDAREARAWLKEQSGNSEYMHNLHTIDEASAVPVRLFGYWCSVMSSYQRAQERLRLAKREKKTNEYVGEIKQRREFVAKLKNRRSFDGAYGTVRLHTFLDEDGHTLVWWANTDPQLALDETYRFKGTVKKHEERNDWKQTVLSRVKVEEVVLENE